MACNVLKAFTADTSKSLRVPFAGSTGEIGGITVLLFPLTLSWPRVAAARIAAPPPLRTGRASHPASGSSHSSAPELGTEQFDRAFRGSTAGQVFGPCRIERIGRSRDFDVASDCRRHRTKQPKADSLAVGRTFRGEVTISVSDRPEVSLLDPPCTFGGMPALCPPPEHVPDGIIDSIKGCFCLITPCLSALPLSLLLRMQRLSHRHHANCLAAQVQARRILCHVCPVPTSSAPGSDALLELFAGYSEQLQMLLVIVENAPSSAEPWGPD